MNEEGMSIHPSVPVNTGMSFPAAAPAAQLGNSQNYQVVTLPDGSKAYNLTSYNLASPAAPALGMPSNTGMSFPAAAPAAQIGNSHYYEVDRLPDGSTVYSLAFPAGPAPAFGVTSKQSKKRRREEESDEDRPYVKKPPNAYMIFLKEQRPFVVQQTGIRESAKVNGMVGSMWKTLTVEQKAPYFQRAEAEAKQHAQQHPDWSSRDNYGVKKRRIRTREIPQQAQVPIPLPRPVLESPHSVGLCVESSHIPGPVLASRLSPVRESRPSPVLESRPSPVLESRPSPSQETSKVSGPGMESIPSPSSALRTFLGSFAPRFDSPPPSLVGPPPVPGTPPLAESPVNFEALLETHFPLLMEPLHLELKPENRDLMVSPSHPEHQSESPQSCNFVFSEADFDMLDNILSHMGNP